MVDDGYEIEVRIPLKSIRFQGSRPAAVGVERRALRAAHRLPADVDAHAARRGLVPGAVGDPHRLFVAGARGGRPRSTPR